MQIRFLTPGEVPLASDDVSLIESIRSELLDRPGVQEAHSAESADALVIHAPWAFREWRYIDRLLADPVIGPRPHKVYTINSDDAGTGLLRGAYCCIPARRFDPQLHAAVPFFLAPNETVLAHAGRPREAPTLLASWRGNPKSNRPLRSQLLEAYANCESIKVEWTDSWLDHSAEEKLHYVQLLRSAKFALCPAGWAPASFRIFESMALGIAPVIIADEFVAPAGPDWRSFSLQVKEADLWALEPILERHVDRHEEMGALAHQAWCKYFKPSGLVAYYANALMACIGANTGSTATSEVKRWRSHRTYSGNGWTLPQRALNRIRRAMHA